LALETSITFLEYNSLAAFAYISFIVIFSVMSIGLKGSGI